MSPSTETLMAYQISLEQHKIMLPKVIVKDIGPVLRKVSPKLYNPKMKLSLKERILPVKILSSKRKSTKYVQRRVKLEEFRGFSENDLIRSSKVRFHVDTNLLAGTTEVLSLNNDANSQDSEFIHLKCGSCGIIFSSAFHRRYHETKCSTTIDPIKCDNVSEDIYWLCPWCPVVCMKVEFLTEHRSKCRERERSIKMKTTSLRKVDTNRRKFNVEAQEDFQGSTKINLRKIISNEEYRNPANMFIPVALKNE